VGHDVVVSPLPRDITRITVLENMRERFEACSTPTAALIRLGGSTPGLVKGQDIEPRPINKAPVREAGEASPPEKVIAHLTPRGYLEHLALVFFGKDALPVALHHSSSEFREDLGYCHRWNYDTQAALPLHLIASSSLSLVHLYRTPTRFGISRAALLALDHKDSESLARGVNSPSISPDRYAARCCG
jgi:hypothetical protein